MAFGQPVNTTYRFDQAQRILSLDCDFLAPTFPGSLRYAREFMARRRVNEKNREMNRLYVVETTPSNTGAIADHAWEVKPSDFYRTALAIAFSANAGISNLTSISPDGAQPWIGPLARDLQEHRGASIVLAGDNQPPEIHALAHAMNSALGNVGKTVFHTDPLEARSESQRESLQDLVKDLDAGRVELLVIVGGNPVYNTPADLKFDLPSSRKSKAARPPE